MNGATINWRDFDKDYMRQKVALPTYPFQRKRYWIDVVRKRVRRYRDEYASPYYKLVWDVQPAGEVGESAIGPAAIILFNLEQKYADILSPLLTQKGNLVFCVIADASIPEYTQLAEYKFALNPASRTSYAALLKQIETLANETNIQQFKIAYMWGMQVTNSNLNIAQIQAQIYEPALLLIQALAQLKQNNWHLYLLTQAAQAVTKQQDVFSIQQAPLWGLGRSIAIEIPELQCVNIDLAPDVALNNVEQLSHLADELVNVALEDQVAFRANHRYVRTLEPVDLNPSLHLMPIAADGAYVVTGGLGGIGLEVAQWLVAQGAKHLVLLGRRQPSTEALDSIKQWEQVGVVVSIASVDVTKSEQLRELFNRLLQNNADVKPIRGIIHAAGSIEAAPIGHQTLDMYLAVMAAKIEGALNLQQILNDFKVEPDFFVNFSSTSSFLGNTGQANYAAANAFLDTFTQLQRSQGVNAYCINWGMWEQVGLAAKSEEQADKTQLAMLGIGTITPQQGIAAFADILAGFNEPQIIMTPTNWDKYNANFVSKTGLAFFSKVLKKEMIKKLELPCQKHKLVN